MALLRFLREEDGQLTIDWTVLVAALMGLGLVVSMEAARGLDKVTDEYAGINTGKGMMTMFVNNPDAPTRTVEDETAPDDTMACNAANPGNDKCVGKAGEAPNGDEGAWGSGSNGMSDGNTNGGKKKKKKNK